MYLKKTSQLIKYRIFGFSVLIIQNEFRTFVSEMYLIECLKYYEKVFSFIDYRIVDVKL
jgi:hypothetical protein